ncbi:MAG: DUF1697 domain-containing protein [Synoicihabitans sp.]
MAGYIAMLRGINLGKRRVKMDHLSELFEELGFTQVRTFLASGNVRFETRATAESKLQAKIARHLESNLGYAVPTLIRTDAELKRIVAEAPLGDLFNDGPKPSTQVTFFSEPLPPEIKNVLTAIRTPTDALAVDGRELYWRCAIGISQSTLWKSPALNPLQIPDGTTRNLNTLTKMVAAFPS